MAVTLCHDGKVIISVAAVMERWPWTTCPGATEVLKSTFTGVTLAEGAARGMKWSNCTHLYDLAIMASAHAGDNAPMVYDVFVSDAVDGRKSAEIRKDGDVIVAWVLEKDIIQEPEALKGVPVTQLRDWIKTLDQPQREGAHVLQWATLIAHGRSIPLENQSDATRMPPNCYTFQPDRAKTAERIGRILDFSGSERRPLDHFDAQGFTQAK